MASPFTIPKARFRNLLLIRKPDVRALYLIPIREVCLWIYFAGLLLAYLASATPWFLWRIYGLFPVMASVPIMGAMLLSRGLKRPLFCQKGYVYPLIAYALLMLTTALVNGRNMNGLIFQMFNVINFASFFMLDRHDLLRIGDWLCKLMGGILAVSMGFYVLYLMGFSLPHYHLANTEFDYSFENYRFFLIDDRYRLLPIPRFHSILLEPSHLAILCSTLLFTQLGRWKRWYNVSMLVALFISFSLAGYVFLVYMLFAASWLKGKAIVGKVLVLCALVGVSAIVAINYNKGDNLVNELIVQRLVINDDGKMEGDNRVSSDFEKAYDKLASSEKILVGEGSEGLKKFTWGNAGYRVYIYSNGLISVALLCVFLVLTARTAKSRKQALVFLGMHFISFIPQALPTKYYFFVPLYILLFCDIQPTKALPTKDTTWTPANE